MANWLITGCSTGIGRGIAKAALAAGHNVAATAQRVEALADIASAYPETAAALRLDLNDETSMETAVRDAEARFGAIDVLVNNAGYGYRAAIEESDAGEVAAMFQTNLFGPVHLMGKVLPSMRERRSGIIVNVSSIGAVRAAVGNGYYSASKAAFELVSDAVAKEAGHLGIRVMIVEPGAFRTSFYDSLKGSSKAIADYDDSVAGMRLENMVNNHDQAGDPDKAGELIVELIDSGSFPSRLPLGSDAVRVVRSELEARLAELAEWERFSVRTDY